MSVTECIPLFVDWLGVSLALSLDEVKPISGCTLVEQTPTKIWNRRAILLNDLGDKMLTVLWSPKSSIIRKSSALLEVANEWFYHGRGAISMIREFCEVNQTFITGISRIDLAADFMMNDRLQSVVWGLAEGSLYVGGKRSGSAFWSVVNDTRLPQRLRGIKLPHCQSWGHKTSSVKWKLYYKWKELCDAAGSFGYEKCYIVDRWSELGFTPEEVWRLEVSVRNCNGLMRDGMHLDFDSVVNNTLDIYHALYTQRFVVRRNQGHADRSNDAVVPFLPIEQALRTIRCSVPVADRPRNAATSLLRNLIRSLDETAILADERLREGVLWQIENICTTQHLVGYASAIVDDNIWSWIESKRVEGASIVF